MIGLQETKVSDEQFPQAEIEALEARRENLERQLKMLLLPRDPNDEKNVVMEIRAGTGARRRPCSPPTSCACTCATPSGRDGGRRY